MNDTEKAAVALVVNEQEWEAKGAPLTNNERVSFLEGFKAAYDLQETEIERLLDLVQDQVEEITRLKSVMEEAREELAGWLIGVEYPESLKVYQILDRALSSSLRPVANLPGDKKQ